ncbi:hypothetical protein J5N97_026358 [Dioscorea zingiberensis]|uniref:Uncharacterized protein n=1 Tax=Dioscorea zingiberensis TaxID=325984 RepID=A0A9D5H6Q1_9LILI|nr:hypothetical protein J5N97_026358 [Dioscorea zingiberensis]
MYLVIKISLSGDSSTPKKAEDAGRHASKKSEPQPGKRRGAKQTAFSDSDTESELSRDDLVKLLIEKESLNNFAESLLDLADNLGRASLVVKESFLKVDLSSDSVGAESLLETLLEGVEMTEKQLADLGMPANQVQSEVCSLALVRLVPNKHHAMFQVPGSKKPSGTVLVVLKFFDMSRYDSIKALAIYKRAGQQVTVCLELARNFLFPAQLKTVSCNYGGMSEKLLCSVLPQVKHWNIKRQNLLTYKEEAPPTDSPKSVEEEPPAETE